MAEVDTSSYPKPLPTQTPLDIVRGATDLALQPGRVTQQQQEIESRGLGIDRQKLENANQALGYMTRAMTALGPNASREQYIQAGRQAVQLGLAPASSLNVWEQKVRSARSTQDFYNEFLSTAANHQEIMNTHLGPYGTTSTGQTDTTIRTPLGTGGRPYAVTGPIQQNQSVNAPSVNERGQPQALGAQRLQFPPGMEQDPNGLPGEMRPARGLPTGGLTGPGDVGPPIQPPATLPVGRLPGVAGPAPGGNFGPPGSDTRVISAQAMPPQPRGAVTGNPAMFEEGKAALLKDQQLATQIQTQIKPAVEALPLIKGLTTGMGTETVNKYLAGLHNLGWLPQGVTDKVAAYQIVNKKLSQFVQGNGTRSDADLAKREESSPNVKGQINPALMKLAKDTIALQRVEAARGLSFDQNGQQRSDLQNYPAHAAKFPSSVDQRAFKLDFMEPDDRLQLIKDMTKLTKVVNGERVPTTFESKKFWDSIRIVDKLGIMDPALFVKGEEK